MEIQNIEPALWEPIRIQTDSAWTTHIPFAHWITVLLAPKSIVELGTHTGVSYAAFCNAVSKSELPSKCFAVDTWQGDNQAGFYDEHIFQDIDTFNKLHFASFSTLLRARFDDALEHFEDGSIDLLHIDGYHSYDAVSHDFFTWLPKMSDKGIILFHDTNEKQEGFGVWKFWEEITEQYPGFQFLHGHGLGVLKVGKNSPLAIDTLFHLSSEETFFYETFFSLAGEKWEQKRLQIFKESEKKALIEQIENQRNDFNDLQASITNNFQLKINRINARNQESLNSKQKEIEALEANIWLFNTEVQSLEKDWLWRYLRKHPKFKRHLTKYIGYTRAFLKKRLKIARREYHAAIKNAPVIAASPYFDADWYRRKYFDVVYSGFSPEMHYVLYGKDGRLPSPLFDARQYQKQYTDVAFAEQAPLLHYELYGKNEGRIVQAFHDIDAIKTSINVPVNTIIPIDHSQLYKNWQEVIEIPHLKRISLLPTTSKGLKLDIPKNCPLFSLLLFLKEDYTKSLIEQVIDSIIEQTWHEWELLIIQDEALCNEKNFIKDLEQSDRRIKLIPKVSTISQTDILNYCIENSLGKYIININIKDVLAPTALQEIALLISQEPNTEIIYADDDHYDNKHLRYKPYFKSDFSLDLLFSRNYIGHFVAFERSLLKSIGGFRPDFGTNDNYDLLLRAVGQMSTFKTIRHIPYILVHKQFESDTEIQLSESAIKIKALQDYFNKKNYSAQILPEENDTCRIRWDVKESPLVSLIIGTRDGYDDLKVCIDSILHNTSYTNFEIIIMDNQSTDPIVLSYFAELKDHPKIRVIPYDKPFNYSAINNLGVQLSKGSIIGLVNNDTEVINDDWLTEMVSHALRPDIGCVGAKLYYPDGSIQHAGVILGVGDVAGHSHRFEEGQSEGYFQLLKVTHNVSAVTGAILIVKKSIFLEVGGLDEEKLTVAYNDVDFCIKVREAGYRNLWTPYAQLIHHESKSRGLDNTPEKMARYNNEVNFMKEKWGIILEKDPYYNPNLTTRSENYTIKISN